MASGTIFAISYVSDLSKVTKENLAVFTVLNKYTFHVPWLAKLFSLWYIARRGGGLRHIKFLIYQHVHLRVAIVQYVSVFVSCTAITLPFIVGLGMHFYVLRNLLLFRSTGALWLWYTEYVYAWLSLSSRGYDRRCCSCSRCSSCLLRGRSIKMCERREAGGPPPPFSQFNRLELYLNYRWCFGINWRGIT